jgi:PAS domain S-box-containing protein
VNTATESVLFNAVPLLLLAGAYFVVAAAVAPAVWRDRAKVHPLEVAIVAIFAMTGLAAALLGSVVLHDQRPVGGQLWLSFAATCIAFVPAALFLLRLGDRALLAGGIRRVHEAEQLVSLRDRELGALATIATALTRARDLESAALPLVEQVRDVLGVEFAAVALVDEEGKQAIGIVASFEGHDASWWRELRLDLRNEPSIIASVVFDAAPVTIYDLRESKRANPRLVKQTGAKSGAWVPIVTEERVVGVVVAATTSANRAFTQEEVSLLQALASETALALDRIRTAEELAEALAREQRVSEIARKLRGELDVDELVRVVADELRAALPPLRRVSVELGEQESDGLPIVVGSERIGTLRVEPAESLGEGEQLLLGAVVRELGLALQTARLVHVNQRRLEQQGALLEASQVVTSELELEVVLERLVEEMTKLLGADGADCYLLDRRRGVLRCAAVHGLDPALVGLEFPADQGLAGLALRRERPVASHDHEQFDVSVTHDAYGDVRHALVAPMVWAGEVRGVLGVVTCSTSRRFDRAETELLEAFAGLASLALRNAESFGERAHQARVQRAFYRIVSLLAEPLSLAETLDTAALAVTEALDGEFGAVLLAEGERLTVAGAHELPDAVRALAPPPVLLDAAKEDRTVASSQLSEDERFDESWRGAPFASLLAIPLEGAVRGLVVVFFDRPHTFSADDLELARQVAQAARDALERSRLYEAERTARSLSQHLARTGSMLGAELDPAAVLEEVVGQAVALLGADAGAVASLERDELAITAATGEGVEAAIGARAPSTGWLGGDVVQLQTPVAREDVATDAALVAADAVLALGYRAYLGVPLLGREGALLGVLSVYGAEPRSWREDEIEALAALAANASVALANAELYQRLALEHEQTVAILSNVADGIVAVERDGRVVVWNAAAEEITGVPASEALGRTPAEVLRLELRSDGKSGHRLVPIMRGSEEVWLSLSETVMRDPAGAIAGRIFAFRDLSAERIVEQMKSDFVSTVSHELRTPLTSIYGFAETLLRRDIDFSDAERHTFLGYIASESERLTNIVDALLNVARLDTGTLEVELRPTDVGAVLSAAVSATRGSAAANGHQLEVDLDEDVPAVRADADKLRQVLDQLIANAVKFSPAGGVVRLEARRHLDAVEITVADEGVGIPTSKLDRIFDKFYRAGDERSGTGLGLFIAQGLVAAMGGKISVHSKEGRGSRFTFELPRAHAEQGAMSVPPKVGQ